MRKAKTLLVAAVMVTGYMLIAPSVAAHDEKEHCYVDSTDPDVWEDVDCDIGGSNPSESVQRTVTISGDYNAPPVEGPGNPDGGGEWGGTEDPTSCSGGCVFPYIFQAVILTQCTPGGALGQDIPSECIRNGGAVFNACDADAHWLNGGGVSSFDAPCSWDRGSKSGDQDSAEVDTARPFDTLHVSFDCATCVVDRQIPFVVTTNSKDTDTFHGEGQGEKPGNNGDCAGTVFGDATQLVWGEVLGGDPPLVACNDNGPGPRELSVNECASSAGGAQSDPITRPDSLEWGSGPGVYQQGLSNETYMTHHLGDDDERVDDGDFEKQHPGVTTLAIFLYGPVHGQQSCGDASPVPTGFGTFFVEIS